MKPRSRPHRAAPIGSPEGIAAHERARERFERKLLRNIRAWARTWERCSLPGCRRNGRCLKSGACRAWSREVSEESRQRIRAALRARKPAAAPAGAD